MRSDILFWSVIEINKGNNIGHVMNFNTNDKISELVWSLSNSGCYYHYFTKTQRPKVYL
jgi:hypothetical protein